MLPYFCKFTFFAGQNILPVKNDLPAVRTCKARNYIEQRRFPAAGRPHNDDKFPIVNSCRNLFQNRVIYAL